jgi:uncharacterized protein (TIGR02453 family)
MPRNSAIFTPETFRFFRDLGRNNQKAWMDENRERYREHVVAPFRALLEVLAPAVLGLDPSFDTDGRTGTNFSRINRDIRFARDKTPYRTQMYVTFSARGTKGRSAGQLYAGISTDAVTAGFRIYGENRDSALTRLSAPRALGNSAWLLRQKKRLGRKYESYWYSMEKGEWTKHGGWPVASEEWKKIRGWIVRKEMKPGAAKRPAFVADVSRILRDLFPLYAFTSQSSWKP